MDEVGKAIQQGCCSIERDRILWSRCWWLRVDQVCECPTAHECVSAALHINVAVCHAPVCSSVLQRVSDGGYYKA